MKFIVLVLAACAVSADGVVSVLHRNVPDELHSTDVKVPVVTLEHDTAHVVMRRKLEMTTSLIVYGVVSVCLAIFIGGLALCISRKKMAGEKVLSEEETDEPTTKAEVNVEKLLKLVTKRAAQEVGPKVIKAHKVKNVLEARVYGLKNKAAGFLLDEVYGVVARVLREVEAEEFMLLLDPTEAAATSLPPATILLAGLLSPIVLTVSMVVHLSQVFMVLIPVLCMCAWAMYMDWDVLNACAVPTLSYWAYFQGGVAFILLVSHLATTVQIQMGKRSLNNKVESMQERLREAVSDGELSLSEIRELFIVSAIILEHALVVEDGLRRSFWRTIIGYGTLAWMVMILWTFIIVLGWTFVPGVVAFHPSAEKTAGDAYCGAWATVFTARLSCVLSLLFLMFNLVSVLQFVSDQLVTSQSYCAAVVNAAKRMDDNAGGLPVMQTLVKAFLLRGNGDSIKDQIEQSRNRKSVLQAQCKDLKGQIDSLNARIDAHKADAAALKKAQGIEDVEADSAEAKAMASGAEDMMAQAKALEQQTKAELQAVYQKLLEASNMLQQSETLKNALAQTEQLQASAAAGMEGMSFAALQQHGQDAVASAQDAAVAAGRLAEQAAEQAGQSSPSRTWWR